MHNSYHPSFPLLFTYIDSSSSALLAHFKLDPLFPLFFPFFAAAVTFAVAEDDAAVALLALAVATLALTVATEVATAALVPMFSLERICTAAAFEVMEMPRSAVYVSKRK
jgi:hypothetical protein